MNFKELFDEINSGKYNMIFLIIVGFLLFHIYFQLNDKKVESMADISNDQIATAVRNYYLSDEFIRNISAASAQIKKNGLTIDGNLTVNGSFNIIPRGTIVSFNSATAPAGWALCDGSNGTPDLRGRFVLSAGQGGNLSNRTLNQTGGAETHTLTLNEIPTHSHKYVDAYYAEVDGPDKSLGNVSGSKSGTDRDNNTFSVERTTAPSGENRSHNNMPPFYVLSYIMKL